MAVEMVEQEQDHSLETRVAVLEERTKNTATELERWRVALEKDISDTKAMIEGMDKKLDEAIDVSRRTLPSWAHYLLWVLIAALGVTVGLVHGKP